MAKKKKKGATGKTYTTYGDRIKVTYNDGSTRVVRPNDASYNATKKAMESDIAGRNPFGIGNKKSSVTAADAIGKGVTEGRGLVASATVEQKAKQAIQARKNNQAATAKKSNDITPKLKTAKNAKEQAQIANEAVADVYRSWAKDPRKVVSPKALKAGAEQGVANLVQGTKAGAFSTAIDLGRAGIAESNPYAAVVEAMGRVRPGNNTEIMAMQNAAYSQIQRQNAEKMAATQRAIANKYGPLNKGEQFVSDIISNAIPMLPAIATGAVTGGAGSMPVIATYARGLGEMQALNEGTSLDKARLYGLGTAALETGTEMMFGGIAGLPGGGLMGKAKGLVGDVAESAELLGKTANRARALERAIGNVDDALHVTNKIKAPTLQRAARATGKVAGEGIEEVVAEALDPALQRATYNPNAENATLGQLAYAGALGSVTAGLMNAGAVGAQRIARVPGDTRGIAETIQNASRERADTALFGQSTAERMAAQEAARQQNAQQQAAEADQNAAQQGQDNNTNPDNPAQRNPANAAGNLPGQAQNGNPVQQTNAPQENAAQPAIRPPQLQRPTLEMQERTFDNVASKNVKAYQQENLAVKPYYQATADQLLSDLQQGIKGGRDVGVNPETRNVTGRGAWKRQQSEPIERMLSDGMTYAQIEDGLQRLVEDNGKENTANAKRAELYVDDAVRKGYDSIVSGNVPANRAFAYHGMSEAELQERLQQLENSFTPDMSEEQARAVVSEMETVTKLLEEFDSDEGIIQQPAQQLVDYDVSQITPDARRWLERVGEVSGMNVRVVDGLAHNANGMFDGNGNILLDGKSVASAETMRKVIGHETYHAMRQTDEHKELQDLAWDWYKLENPDATQQDMLNAKIAQYAESGVTLDAESAWDEIGAEFTERLMTDEATAKRVIAEQPNLAQRIWRKIQQILQRFTGKLSAVEQQQRDILLRAEKVYRDGLRSMQYQGGTQSGENGSIRYMFAGERSQTANREALEQAKQMAAHGVDMETIRQQTGWFRSNVTGGKWAYEIDDSGATINSNKDAYALEDYYNHPELYRAYPQLRDIYLNRMSQQELGAGVLGRYSGSQIDYSNNEVIPHEVQHAVQDIEGFPKGSNPRYWQRKLDNEEISLEQFPRYKTAEAEKRRMFESFPNDIKEKIREINRLYLTNDDANIDKALALEQEIYDSEWGDNYAAYDMADFEMRSVHARLHSGDLNAEDLYRNTAGEIMARDTKARRDLTAEQRRQKRPQMGDADTVYAGGGNGYAIDTANLKAQQLTIIQNSNPMQDDYHTGIRDVDDILTFEEALENESFTPDYTEKMAQNALQKGVVTIYSSQPIQQGVFVTPSKMEAQNYAGGGKVYSKKVGINDVAWIDTIEGQYAKVNTDSDVRYSLNNSQQTANDNRETRDSISGNDLLEYAAQKGYSKNLYHQTGAKFTSFNTDNQKAGKYDHETPTGIFLKPDDSDIGLKGNIQMNLVANIQNPLHFSDRYNLSNYWKKNVPGYSDIVQEIAENDARYQSLYDEADRRETELYQKIWSDRRKGIITQEQFQERIKESDYETDLVLREWENADNALRLEAKGLLDDYMKNSGYDGIIIDNDAGSFGRSVTSYIVFNSSQVKSADTVTYDDNGNPIPLNERFNPTNPDIRYNLNTDRDVIGSEEYKALLDEYDAMPPGEDPTGANNLVEVPRSTADGNRVRQFVRNVIEAPSVDDVTANMVAEKLINDTGGDLVHEPIANKAVLDEVNARIARNGWEQEYNELHAKVQAGDRITVDDIAMGTRLIQEAQKAGNHKSAVNLVTDLAVAGTELGQSIQAFKMLKRLTPEGQLLALKKAQRRINQSLEKQNKKPVSEMSEETAIEFMEARSNRRRDEIWNREIARMGQETAGTWMDKLNALRYAAMLSNPKTHIRNIFGNIAMTIARQPTILISSALEEVRDKTIRPNGMAPEHYRTIKNRTGQSYNELKDYAETNYKAFAEQVLRAGGSRYQDISGAFSNSQRVFGQSLPGRVLEQVAGNGKYAVGSVLEAEDMWFKHRVYRSALIGYMRANGITTAEAAKRIVKPNGASIEKGEQYALRQAQKATFTEENRAASNLSRLENTNTLSQVLLGSLMPFKKTPMNILVRGVEYSPAGIGMTGYKLINAMRGKKDKQGRNYNINDVFESLAANITGTGLMYLGYRLAIEGFLAGTGDDDDKRKARYDSQMGSQNFAIVDPETGDSWTIDWLAPAAMPLFAGVEVYKQLSNKYDVEDESTAMQIAAAMGRITDPVFEMSCMQGVTDALASYSGDSGEIASTIGTNIITGYPSQFIPAIAGAAARTFDDTVRSSYTPKMLQVDDGSTILPQSAYLKEGESFLRQQRGKILGASMYNEPSIDLWGNERKRESAGYEPGDIAMRAFHNFINPGNYSSNKRTVLDEELTKLYEQTGESGVLPKTAQSTINETQQNPKIYLTPHEYSRLATTQGKKSQQYVSDFVNSSTYKNLDDDTKAEIVSDLYSLAAYQARKEALKGRGYKDYSVDIYEDALASGVKPYSYYATKARFGGKWADYDVVSKYAEAADKIGLSDKAFTSHYDAMNSVEGGKGKKDRKIAYLDQQKNAGKITNEQYWYLRINFAGNPSKTEKASCPYRWMVE